MPEPLALAALTLVVMGAFFALAGAASLRRGRALGVARNAVLALLLLALGTLCASIGAGMRGYRALTREEVAAVVTTRPNGPQQFRAEFLFPDGQRATFQLAGDEFQVDAHILKWKPFANVLGLHTAYELDRVAGRYAELADERAKRRTVFPLGDARPVDLFGLRRRYDFLSALVDAQYGSATFVPADEVAVYEVRVSTTGLLVRPLDSSG